MRTLSRGSIACCAAVLFCAGALLGGEDEAKVKVNFAGLDLSTLARQVERVTKKSFLFDENTLRNIRTTLQSDMAITPQEFYRVFQTVCQMNDLVLIPVEGTGISLEKIVRSQAAFKEPGVHPVLVHGDELPKSDALVSYLVKLKHAGPTRVTGALTPSLSAAGSVLQIPNTDLLLVSDVASSIKRMEKIIALLDTPGEPVTTSSLKLANISVEKAQTMLTEYNQALFKAVGGETGREKLATMKDERLGVLHLIGPEKEVAQAVAFLGSIDLDAPAARRTIKYYKLNNVPVKDIVDYVGELLGVALSARDAERRHPGETIPAASVPPQAPPPVPGAAQAPAPARSLVPRPAGQGARPDGTQLPADIIPVEGLNTLVVAGDAAVHQEVEAILKNLDKRKGQVLIEVAIIQVTGDDSLDLGFEALSVNDARGKIQSEAGSGFGLGTQADTQTRGFPTETALASVTGAAYRFVKDNNLQALLKALATKSNVSIVSQPLLLVNDNEDGSFTTKVSEPTITTSQGTATTNTSFSGFADATTTLKITPHISPDGYLNLEIAQTFEEFTGPPAGAGIPPPKVSNQATTKVTVPDRQTVVVGGFTRDSSTLSRTGVPGLMQIPGLGKVFSRESKKKTASRLYLFVRPKILTAPAFEDLKAESSGKKDDVEQLSKKSRIKTEIKERIGRAEVVPDEDTQEGRKKCP